MATTNDAPKAPEAPVPLVGRAALEERVAKLMRRITDVNEIFKDVPQPPEKNPEFKKFLGDQFAEIAMRYITMGVVRDEDQAPLETKLKQPARPEERLKQLKDGGFAVAESAPEPPPESDDGRVEAETGDPAFDLHPAVDLARTLGFNPNAPLEDD